MWWIWLKICQSSLSFQIKTFLSHWFLVHFCLFMFCFLCFDFSYFSLTTDWSFAFSCFPSAMRHHYLAYLLSHWFIFLKLCTLNFLLRTTFIVSHGLRYSMSLSSFNSGNILTSVFISSVTHWYQFVVFFYCVHIYMKLLEFLFIEIFLCYMILRKMYIMCVWVEYSSVVCQIHLSYEVFNKNFNLFIIGFYYELRQFQVLLI